MIRQTPVRAYAPESPLDQLRTAELLVVAVLRLWAAPLREPDRMHPHWQNGFLAADVGEDGLAAFDRLMRVVLATARHPLDLRCPHCPHLGEDEARLLDAVSLLQQRCHAEAAAIMDGWLPPSAARVAMPAAVALAVALGEAGLRLSGHPQAAVAPVVGAIVPRADRGILLTH